MPTHTPARPRTSWTLALAATGVLAASGIQAQSPAPQHPYLADFFVEYQRPGSQTESSTAMGRAPIADDQTRAKFDRLVSEMVDPQSTLDIVVGRPRVLRLNETPVRIQIPDEDVAAYLLVSDREISINGIKPGTTTFNIWFENPDDRRNPRILSYLVRVVPDPEERARVERTLDALESELGAAFPESHIELMLVGEKVVVRGQAATARDAEQIINIVSSSSGVGEDERLPVASAGDPAVGTGPTLQDYIISTNRQIVNQLIVTGEAQINLRVTVAEVNRSATRSLGSNWVFQDNEGDFSIGQLTAGLLDGGLSGNVNTADVNIPFAYTSKQGHIYRVTLNALRSLNLARSLSEPNLVTLNGRPASLRSGGQFPIPVVAGGTDSGLLGVEFQNFGIDMNFTPYVMGKDRIRLQVDFEASTRSNESSLSVGSGAVGGLDTRSFSSIVEMREGETLAVAGLVQTNYSAGSARIPFFGDLPVVGFLFGTNSTSHGEQELLILVTPEIVYPMAPDEVGPLPGTGMYEPSDLEFFLLNKLESSYLEDWRSSARTDIAKQFGGRNYPYYIPNRVSPFEQMRRSENLLISGPSGHSDNLSSR